MWICHDIRHRAWCDGGARKVEVRLTRAQCTINGCMQRVLKVRMLNVAEVVIVALKRRASATPVHVRDKGVNGTVASEASGKRAVDFSHRLRDIPMPCLMDICADVGSATRGARREIAEGGRGQRGMV